jgi:uncharacterized protein YabN with tetrapyrrole methylase and pyrophosphatase domain
LISLAWLKNYGKGILVDIWQKLVELEQASDKFGLCWPNALEILKQIKSECVEIEEQLVATTVNRQALQEEIGDLLHACTSLAWFCGLDSHQTLIQSTNKFEKRLEMMKVIASEQGFKDLKNQPFEKLMQVWQQAKKRLDHKS